MMTKEEAKKAYPHLLGLSYEYRGRFNKFTILAKEKYDRKIIDDLIFIDYEKFINERMSEKVSENNIIKFLNKNGIECVNRKHYK